MTKYKDNTAYSQNNTNSALERYAVDGYTPPAGVVGKEAVREMQRWLGGLTPDGLWGPKTQKQFDKAMAAVLKTAEVPPAPANAERLGYAEDLYKLSIGIGKSGRGNYMVRGYDPPANIKSAEDVRAFQEIHGLDVDGVWGERTKQRLGQLQQRWAGQYDVDELARLAAEGLNKLTGEPGNALQVGAISLRSGKGAGIIPLSAGNGEEQTVGAQAGAKPVTLGGAKQEEILQGRPIEKPDKYFQAQSNQKPLAQRPVILQKEDKGTAVENVQRWLEQLGFLDMSVSIDKQGNKQYGFYGGATRAAVMLYQFNYGFDITGELDSRQYLNIYNSYLHEAEDGKLHEKVDAYYNMVNVAMSLDEKKGYRHSKYPTYYDLPERKPSLPSPMKEAGIGVAYKDGFYYMDYTEPLLKMLKKNIGEAEQARKSTGNLVGTTAESLRVAQDLAWFYFKVEPGAIWDIKEEDNWKAQFPRQTEGVKFFHQAYPFMFLGNVVTAEDMGNILFGATGAAMGFAQEFLKWAGATPNIKADGINLFKGYFGDNDRDLEKVEYGVRFYNALQESGSVALAH